MKIDQTTMIYCPNEERLPVSYGIRALQSDLKKILGVEPTLSDKLAPNQIRIEQADMAHDEAFRVAVRDAENCVCIEGNDALGMVFGIYHFCECHVGVDPYGFWTDLEPKRRDEIVLPEGEHLSPPPAIRYRGWFVNDEDCLMGWHDEMKISQETWRIIFETLLRAGYNMIIPGTGVSAADPQVQLAADMGLWITQHHAEPLGARMLSEAFPDVEPLYPESLESCRELYREAIEINQGRKVVWALGFRGQGDCPFYHDDPRHDTLARRGKVISDVIRLQKEMILKHHKGPSVFAHNLYGESAELYRAGHLNLDDDVIRVWSDNGFGAMRMRRRGVIPEENVSTLPRPEDSAKPNGIYYHVNFHDLQISNHVVPLVDPNLINEQFRILFDRAEITYLTLNVGNIRPHVFDIELIGKLARFDSPREQPVDEHYAAFCRKQFPEQPDHVADMIRRYYETPFHYDSSDDAVAGEQVYHHCLRAGIRMTLKNEEKDATFGFIYDRVTKRADCFKWLMEKAAASLPNWQALHGEAKTVLARLSGRSATYFKDSVGMHIAYMRYSCDGFVAGMRGLLAYENKEYKDAFVCFSAAKRGMESALNRLIATDHDQWNHFHRGEWLTGTRETIRQLRTIQGLCKIFGDTGKDPRNGWLPNAMRLTKRTHNRLAQSSCDYDRLAEAILRERRDPRDDDYSPLL